MKSSQRSLLILASKLGYQTHSFVAAAERLGLGVVFGTDRCHQLEDPWSDDAIALQFEDAEESARRVISSGRRFDAVVALGDRPTPTAARVCSALGLPGHSVAAADACRDKHAARAVLARAGLNVPRFRRIRLETPAAEAVAQIEASIGFPCVLKPLSLSGSRGVIRADDRHSAIAAFERIVALLRTPDVRVLREGSSEFIQSERYISGAEVAVEALQERGTLRVLAIFDKPDPLDGPFFEETIYVTPSRLPIAQQQIVIQELRRAVSALCLSHGPIHAEFRVNDDGAWPLEVAARSIGGLCSRALRFTRPSREGEQTDQTSAWMSLEEVLVRLALGESVQDVVREPLASGVMMIPIPQAGIYRDVTGVDEALAMPYVEEVEITAKPEQKLVPLPEGASYLGFIFARAPRPEHAETALRAGHSRLEFEIAAELPVLR